MIFSSRVLNKDSKSFLSNECRKAIGEHLDTILGHDVSVMIFDHGNKYLRDNLRKFIFGKMYPKCIHTLKLNGNVYKNVTDFHDNYVKEITGVPSISKANGSVQGMLQLMDILYLHFLENYKYQLPFPNEDMSKESIKD